MISSIPAGFKKQFNLATQETCNLKFCNSIIITGSDLPSKLQVDISAMVSRNGDLIFSIFANRAENFDEDNGNALCNLHSLRRDRSKYD